MRFPSLVVLIAALTVVPSIPVAREAGGSSGGPVIVNPGESNSGLSAPAATSSLLTAGSAPLSPEAEAEAVAWQQTLAAAQAAASASPAIVPLNPPAGN